MNENMINAQVTTTTTTTQESAPKLTEKIMYNKLIAVIENQDIEYQKELLEFLNKKIDAIDKKAEKSKEARASKVNSALYNALVEVMTTQTEPISLAQLVEMPSLATYVEETKEGVQTFQTSTQKLAYLMSGLVKNGKVEKKEARVDKRKIVLYTYKG